MRHRKKKGRLSRLTSHRKATFKSMANDLFMYQRIETTLAKAKALRSFVEPLITLAKNNPISVNARRQAFRKLCDKDVVRILFSDIAPLYKDIAGGYTRIMSLARRKGDGASMVIMELTKRTISDEKLLGLPAEKQKPKEKKAKESKAKENGKKTAGKKEEPSGEEKTARSAPEVDIEKKEERTVEDVKKEKARSEQKKVNKRGIFKRFRRKSMG
ncbi:MAG: 50S ribosomal protein L17 [Candidatus Omnitrophota bacterium]